LATAKSNFQVQVEIIEKGVEEFKGKVKNLFVDVSSFSKGIDLGNTFKGFNSGVDEAFKKVEDLQKGVVSLLNTANQARSTGQGSKSLFSQDKITGFQNTLTSIPLPKAESATEFVERSFGKQTSDKLVGFTKRISEAKTELEGTDKWLKQNKGLGDPGIYKDMERSAMGLKMVVAGLKEGSFSIRNFSLSMQFLKKEFTDLVIWQARWYGTKMLLFAPMQIGAQIFREGFEYLKLVDEWSAKLLRWSATSGKVTEEVKKDVAGLIIEIRKAKITIPIKFEDLAKSVESFIGAGIPEKVVKQMVPKLAQLRIAFPEINAEQFGVAITGIYNSMKDSMKGVGGEAEKIMSITEKLLRAQARGVIRPEQFIQVIQHLGEMSRQAGFNIDEMLALSVVVTDLGSKAGNASRSLRGMMESLMKPRNLKRLNDDLGITIDRSKDLASQFIPTMRALQKVMGESPEGSGRSIGALSVLSTIFPVERVKSVTAAMDYLQKYIDLVDDIGKAQGGLKLSADVMANTVGKQLTLLGNRWNELSLSVLASSGQVKEFIGILNEMLLGALLAVGDKAVLAGKYIIDLGSAGKATFVIFTALAGVFNTFKTVLSAIFSPLAAIFSPFKILIDAIAGTGAGITTLSTIISGIFIGALISMISKIGFVASAFSSMLAFIVSIPIALTNLSAFMSVFWTKNIAIFAAIMAITTAIAVIEKYKTKQNEPIVQAEKTNAAIIENLGSNKFKEGTDLFPGGGVNDVEIAMNNSKAALEIEQTKLIALQKKLEKPTFKKNQEETLKRVGLFTPTPNAELTRQEDMVKKAQEQYDSFREKYLGMSYEETQKKLNTPEPPLKIKDVSYSKLHGAVNKYYAERIKTEKDKEKESISIQDYNYKLGYTDFKDYLDSKLNASLNANKVEEENLKEQLAKEKEVYEHARGALGKDAKNVEKLTALDEEYANNKSVIDRRLLEIGFENNKLKRDNLVATYEFDKGKYLEYINWKMQLETKEQEHSIALLEKTNDMKLKVMSWFNEKGLLSDTAMKKAEEKSDAEILAGKKANLENELSLFLDVTGSKLYYAKPEDRNKIYEEELSKRQEIQQKIDILEQDALDKKQDRDLKYKDRIKYVYEGPDGVTEVIKKAFQDLSTEWDNVGQHIYDVTKNITTGMEASFADFFDYMSDSFMDFENLAKNVLHTIYMELLKTILLKQVMGGLFGGTGGIGGMIAGFIGVSIPAMATGGSVSLNKAYIVGEKGPELFTPNSSGNITPNNMLGGQPNMMVNINVENQTGQQVAMSTKGMRFDGEKYIVEAILKNYDSYGPIYHMFQKGR
jgi:TP901 family phage tail tape measure protein